MDPYGARKFMTEGGVKYLDADEFDVQSQTEDFHNDNEPSKRLPRIKPRERRPKEEEQKRNREFLQANPKYFITMNPRIEAYSLSTNEWSKSLAPKLYPIAVLMLAVVCDLDYFEPSKWNAAAFDHLVLDQDYKDILATFSHTRRSQWRR
jgi:hypothetical protein